MMLEPLLLDPVYVEKIWGGRNLERLFGRRLPAGKIGESFEIACRGDGDTTVAEGAEKGKRLSELIAEDGPALMGRAIHEKYHGRFPLLVKILDANDILSVQVHPTDAYAAQHETGGDTGKEETWFVIEAREGARLIKGLKPGTTPETFARLLKEGRLEACLNAFPVSAGDVVHVPTGTVHAIGAGLVLAEIQRNSNVTYRVYDWNRVGADGEPRPLHVDDAMEVIDWHQNLPDRLTPAVLGRGDVTHKRLAACDFYEIESYEGRGAFPLDLDGEAFRMAIVIRGTGRMRHVRGETPFAAGQSVLIPAAMGHMDFELEAPSLVLMVRPV